MKKAFTLAEVLITLGIIGVIAALIVPAISNVKPDKNKTAYLQVYDTISSTVNSLAHNSKIYPTCKDLNEVDNVNCDQNPLFNTNLPLEPRYRNNRYSGDKKLCSLMATSLGISDGDIDAGCTDTVYAFNAANYTNGFANPSFVTKNGMRWRISPAVASSSDGTFGTYQTDIYVDIDATNNDTPNGDRSCIYDQNNCTEPDIFKFMVTANGEVTPADPMGREYIQGRKSLIRKDTEINNHVIANATTDRTFGYRPCVELSPEERCNLEGKFWYNETCNDCPIGETMYNGTCMTEQAICTAQGQHWYNGACNFCPQGQQLVDGACQIVKENVIVNMDYTVYFVQSKSAPSAVLMSTQIVYSLNHALSENITINPSSGRAGSCTIYAGGLNCSAFYNNRYSMANSEIGRQRPEDVPQISTSSLKYKLVRGTKKYTEYKVDCPTDPGCDNLSYIPGRTECRVEKAYDAYREAEPGFIQGQGFHFNQNTYPTVVVKVNYQY